MLNSLQKKILEAILQSWFEPLKGLTDKSLAAAALKAIVDDNSLEEYRTAFIQANILDNLNSIRLLYQHPCPQNCAIGSANVIQEENFVVLQDPVTKLIKKEPRGLLGLTAFSEPNQTLTKQDVIDYVEVIRKNYLLALQEQNLNNQQVLIVGQNQQIDEATNNNQSANFFQIFPEKLWEQAQQHYQQKQAYEALGCLNQLVQLRPENAEYQFLRALCFVALKRREEALMDFSNAIKQRPLHAQTWVERGFTLENLGNLEGALRDYQRALQIHPDHAFALTRRASLNMYQGKVEEAQQDYHHALQLKPEDPQIYISRGEQWLWLERYPEAIADFNEAIRLRPEWEDLKAMKAEAERLLAKAAQEQNKNTVKNSSRPNCTIS